ncbi:hypothetical protein [Streptomyces sp. 891-h]|uniref:hypothetical protein n=1 Tax=Streptomyces sp. 891-h TaxID=2720714 RepID=UPI001FA9F77D|nr:hypothetical protein [Streptomyces sp. 891-h]UNZ18885.1 hypothetical protein HC362_19385 [Streptomyces sp. 891-h]
MDITIPGALADFLAGTNLATGADDHDPASRATREALDAGRRGRGRTLIITPTIDVLHVISEYAETLLATDEATRAERRAARLWIERAGHARHRVPAQTKQATDAAPVILRADEVRPGDTVLACFGDDLTVDTATEAHAIEHAEPYTAAPAPYNPACGCTACATYKNHESPLVNLATDTPWETCDPAPADAPTLIRRRATADAEQQRAQRRQQLADARPANAYPLAVAAVRQVVREMPRAGALRVRVTEGSPEATLTRDDLHALAYSGHTTADAVARVRTAVDAHIRHGEREVHVMFPALGMRPALYLADVLALLRDWEITQAAATNTEAGHAAALVTEADAVAGTWRGEWIGEQADDALFAVEQDAEQGALFTDRTTD